MRYCIIQMDLCWHDAEMGSAPRGSQVNTTRLKLHSAITASAVELLRLLPGAEQIGQAGDKLPALTRELPVERKGDIDISALAGMRHQQPAALRSPARHRRSRSAPCSRDPSDQGSQWPRSSTQPSKSAGVIVFGQVSSGLAGSSSLTGAVLVHDALRRAAHASSGSGAGKLPLWY